MKPKLYDNMKGISTFSTILMWLLLLLVLLKPSFILLLIIFIVTGCLGTLITVYYSTQIYINYRQDEIRSIYAHFQNFIDISGACSKPFAILLYKAFGTIYSMAFMGIIFIVASLNNILIKPKKS